MKLFHINHGGHYLGGTSVVVAPDKNTAIQLFHQTTPEHGIPNSPIYHIEEIDLTKAKCYVLDNGDY